MQALSQLPYLYRAGYSWKGRGPRDPHWTRDPALQTMLWMMVPGTIGLAATQVNILINTILATSQGPGAVSWLNYSFRLMQFPIGVFGVSLASATLPRVSKLWVERDIKGVQDTLIGALRHVFAVNLPASAGLAFLGYPIAELIFQYGRFHQDDTRRTALALAMYSIGLTAYSGVKVLVPACYALGNTRLPVISTILTVTSTVILNLLMIRPFGYWGLALGTSIGALLNFTFLLWALRGLLGRAGGGLPLEGLGKSLATHLGVALAMGAVCYYSHLGLDRILPDAWVVEEVGKGAIALFRALKVALLVGEGVFVVLLLSQMFHISETTETFEIFLQKVKNKLSRPTK